MNFFCINGAYFFIDQYEHMLWVLIQKCVLVENKNNNFQLFTLIWRPEAKRPTRGSRSPELLNPSPGSFGPVVKEKISFKIFLFSFGSHFVQQS